MMQATPTQMGLLKAMRQQAMRDQDRERAMFKDAAYRAKLEAALHCQLALSDVEQRQQAEAELQRLSDVYEHRVDRIGEAHVEAAVYMQKQNEARVAQEQRLAELNERQEQRFQSALSALKAQKGVAKAQAAAVQQRRVQILRAARDKAQAFTAEQISRAHAQKRRQGDLERQEQERRKRSANGLAMDFRQTRLHEGQGPPAPKAEPVVVSQSLPDPIESAEELQHRAAMEKRRREAAAAEAEIRARERFLAAQAKLRAEAQKRAVEAELAELAAQRLQAKKRTLAAHRLHLRDQRKQQELQRVFEDNFLSSTAAMEDDLAPRELPAFLKPVAAGATGGRPTLTVKAVPADALPQAARTRVPLPPLPPSLPCSTVPEDAALPRWSKCRTAPLGRQPPPPPLPVPWAPSNASPPTPKEEVAVQTDPELLAPAAVKLRQDSGSDHEGFSPEPGHAAATPATTEEENSTARRLAWSDPEYMATPSSTVTTAAVPQPTPSPEPTEPIQRDQSPGRGKESPHPVPPAKAEVQRPLRPAPLPGAPDTKLEDIQLGLADGDDEVDAWGELEVDRELARMKKELGIEDSDLQSSISSIDSGISVPSFLKDAAVVAIVRQAGPHTGVKAAAARARAEATAAAPESKHAGAADNATAADRSEQLSHATSASPCQGQGPRTAAADTTTPMSEPLGPSVVAAAAGGEIGTPAAASRPPPTSGITNAVAALDALGAILRPASAGSSSSVDTLDSSILRILDSSPSSTTMPTPQVDATPAAQRAAGLASRPGGAAWQLTHRTPGSSSLPSDIDDMLLLSELDWEELERLAGLRGTNIKIRGSSSPANVATPSPAGLLGATAKTPVRFDGTGAFGAAAVGGFKGFSPSSTFSEISSSVSDESLQRFVAQGE
ncbi:hypothetical protein Vafri_302 [Volvox africanus]|nr:hypothetical protein Vafri_302 [Volvox africanus]